MDRIQFSNTRQFDTSPKMLDTIVGETAALALTNLINKLRFMACRPEAFCLPARD